MRFLSIHHNYNRVVLLSILLALSSIFVTGCTEYKCDIAEADHYVYNEENPDWRVNAWRFRPEYSLFYGLEARDFALKPGALVHVYDEVDGQYSGGIYYTGKGPALVKVKVIKKTALTLDDSLHNCKDAWILYQHIHKR